MTITKEEIELARKKLETLEAAYKEQEDKVWPKVGDVVFTVSISENKVIVRSYDPTGWHKNAAHHGFIHRTKKEADKHLFAMNVEADFMACEGARKFKMGTENWCIYLSEVSFVHDRWTTTSVGWKAICFDTPDQLDAAIAKVGESNLLTAMRWTDLGE